MQAAHNELTRAPSILSQLPQSLGNDIIEDPELEERTWEPTNPQEVFRHQNYEDVEMMQQQDVPNAVAN
jgi:hypothetical protein